jgi:hypothetical protein
MRRLPIAVATVAAIVSASLCVPALPAAADTPTTLTPAELATQANMETMLSNLQDVVGSVNANPSTAAELANASIDPLSAIASAQQVVAQLSPDQLDQLQAALNQDPSWQQIPTRLSGAVQSFTPAAGSVTPKDHAGTFTDSCDSAGSAPPEFLATVIANQVQSAAQAAMLAAPGVFATFFVSVPTGVKIALAVIWGVTNAIYLALQQVLAVATDCAQTVVTNTQLSVLPVDPSDSSLNVPASSEISVQSLISQATGTQTEITNVLNTVNAVNAKADTLISNATDLNATLTDINTRVAEVQSDLQTLQTNVNVLENTEVTVLEKADTEIANLNTFQTLQVRMLVEENLARNGTGTGPVGLFQLPAAFGGYLDVVKSIVNSTFANETASGRPPSAQANAALATANSDFTAHLYKAAYTYYTKAYQDVR